MKKGLFSLVFAFAASFGFAQCDPLSEIDESFDGWGQIDECWAGVTNGGMFLVEDDVTFYSTSLSNLSMYLISPEIVEGQYNLTFDFGTLSLTGGETEGITIEVGTVTGNENADSFFSISEPLSTTVAVQSFDVPVTITSDAKFIAIKYSSIAPHSAAYVDNFVLTSDMAVSDLETAKVSVYPNPVLNELNISTGGSTVNEVKIFSLNGQLVQVSKLNSNTSKVNVSALKPGVYVAQIETAKGTQTVKVVKK